jgi:hypothetical protein
MHTPFNPLGTTISILLLLAIFSLNAIGQVQTAPVTKETYFKKSKKQKTVACILLGAGAGALFMGAFINEDNEDVEENFTPYNNNTKTTAIVSGAGCMLLSIPLFIASKRNKRKAMSMSFKNQNIRYIALGRSVTKIQPALTFRMNL